MKKKSSTSCTITKTLHKLNLIGLVIAHLNSIKTEKIKDIIDNRHNVLHYIKDKKLLNRLMD